MKKLPESLTLRTASFVEEGTWRLTTSGKSSAFTLHAWTDSAPLPLPTSSPTKPRRDRLALARYYQKLLDDGTARNRADLARYLGVSRARVTQVLSRLTLTNTHELPQHPERVDAISTHAS